MIHNGMYTCRLIIHLKRNVKGDPFPVYVLKCLYTWVQCTCTCVKNTCTAVIKIHLHCTCTKTNVMM